MTLACLESQLFYQLYFFRCRFFSDVQSLKCFFHNVDLGHMPGDSQFSAHLLFDNFRDFPGGPVVKNPPANTGDMGLISGLGRFHMLQLLNLICIQSPCSTTGKDTAMRSQHPTTEWPLLTATRQSPSAATKTKHSQN